MSTEATAAAATSEMVPVAPGAPAPAAAAPAPAAPPAAPATPPAAEPASAPEEVFEPSGNGNVDYALGVISKAGIGPNHPAAKAAMEGDFGMLRHALAAAGVQGSDHLIAMIEREAIAESEREAADAKSIGEAVVSVAGSPEHWEDVVSWARTNADADEVETINGLLASKGTAKIAAHYLVSMYDASLGDKEPLRSAVPAGASVAQAQPQGKLSRQEFAREADKLYRQYGDAYVNTPAYKALGQRL